MPSLGRIEISETPPVPSGVGECPTFPSPEFFDAASGKTRGAYDLDHEELLPYPTAKYGSIPRNAFSLVLSKSTRCVGSFLDVWTHIYFDDSRRLLQLETYRPTGEPFRRDGSLLCNAEPRWVEIELIP